MRTIKRLLLLATLLLTIHSVNAQSTGINPDCVVFFDFTFNAGSPATMAFSGGNGFDNRTIGCQTYVIQYTVTASSGSITSVAFQTALGATAPGTFSNFNGTVSTGINPNTSNTTATSTFATGCASAMACTVTNSWLKVLITSGTLTGTVNGVLYGFRQRTGVGGGGGGGGGPTIAGTTNEIAVAGAGCTSGSTATCTISIPSSPVLPGNPSTPGTFSTGVGSGETGAYDLVGKTSGAVSTISVDDSNTATKVNLPNDATSGLYVTTSPTSTPAAGCAQYNGTGTQATSTGSPCGSGGGGTSAHHTYYVAAAQPQVGLPITLPSMLNVSSAVNSLTPTNYIGVGSMPESATFNIVAFLPSTWTGSLTITVDAMTSTNGTGNYSLTPSYFCVTNGTDLVTGVSYTSGSTVTHAAPGGSGSGFYRQSFAMTVAATGCVQGGSIEITVTRGASDSYSSTVYILGADLSITY